MKNRILIISREFGSGGRTVGKTVAQRLRIPCYDSELIQKIAEESGFTEGYVARREESAPAGSCPPPLPPGPLAPPMRTICGRSSGR